MPIPLIEISKIVEERGEFYNRIRGGVIKTAAEIYSEDIATPNHSARLVWAKNIILEGNYEQRTKEMYRLALTLPSVLLDSDSISDEDIILGIKAFLPQVI